MGICSLNRFEFYIADFACTFFNLMVVPIHTIYGEDSLEIVMNNCEATCIISDNERFVW